MTALDGWLWFDAGVIAWCALLALRYALGRLLAWYTARRSRREIDAWRRLRRSDLPVHRDGTALWRF